MENINEISKVVTSPVGKLSLIDIEKAEVMLLQLAKLIQTLVLFLQFLYVK